MNIYFAGSMIWYANCVHWVAFLKKILCDLHEWFNRQRNEKKKNIVNANYWQFDENLSEINGYDRNDVRVDWWLVTSTNISSIDGGCTENNTFLIVSSDNRKTLIQFAMQNAKC